MKNIFRRNPRRKAKRSQSRAGGGRRIAWTALLATGVVVVLVGGGLLNWAQSRTGKAALLGLGADRNYADVQAAVDDALAAALPGFRAGPAEDPADHDWPAPAIGPGALVRCRVVPVPAVDSWWDVQARVAAALAPTGAKVLWGERVPDPAVRAARTAPDDATDLLRLDVGVTGRPTHTLMLVREGRTPPVRWGGGPGLSRWREFAAAEGPVVALVIDDWGHGKTPAALSILDLPIPVTMAVLPDLPYSRHFSLQGTELVLPPGRESVAAAAMGTDGAAGRRAAGCPVDVAVGRQSRDWPQQRREIMLHLPMEPQGYPETDPGPDAILVGMDAAAVSARLDAALATLDHASGVNNHMGSAATSDLPTMRALMSVLAERDLFFVDSLTSSRSVAYAEAVRAGIPAARNRIFLDYDNENEDAIRTNLLRLVKAARSVGTSLGIGHPHPATAAVLAREIPRLVAEGVRFVTVSELMALRAEAAQVASSGAGDGHGG